MVVFCMYTVFMYTPGPEYISKKAMSGEVENPQKTFFFERENGEVFSVNEPEAWRVYSGKNQSLGIKVARPKLIGTSDGRIVANAISEAKRIFQEYGIEKAQEHIKEAHQLEIEEARKHVETPRNYDTIGQNGQPVKVSELR